MLTHIHTHPHTHTQLFKLPTVRRLNVSTAMGSAKKRQTFQPTAALAASVIWLMVVHSVIKCQADQLQPQPFGWLQHDSEGDALRMPTRLDEDVQSPRSWDDGRRRARPSGRKRNEEIALRMATRGDEGVYLRRDDGRQAQVSCHGDADVCRDPLRNPGGGSTCCWNRVCKDTENDVNHCGKCGSRCGFGLHCCGGSCVNYLWDNFNCGCCGQRCLPPSQCAFGMCGYAGTPSR